MKSILTTILLLVFASHLVNAQQRVVTGSVYAFKDLCLKNIKVEAKKSGAAVSTDSLGNFSIVCEKKDRLTFTGAGFSKVIKNVKKQDHIKIKMIFEGGEENEEVAIGYGIVNEKDLTFAISHLSDYNNDFSTYTDIFQLIQGKFAGVQVVNDGGVQKILVRGMSSINGDNFAIYVVDGVRVDDISYLTPTWIKSIDILKDGSASIYGTQGGTGVVLITTSNGVE